MIENKKTVLIFAVQFYPETSGYSFATANFVKAIKDHFQVTVMTPVEKPVTVPEISGITIRRDSKKGFRKYFYQFKILFYVIKNLKSWDVIFFDTAEMFILGNIITAIARQKTIVRFHGCMTTEAAYFSKKPMMRIWKFFIRKWIKKSRIITMTTPFYIDFINRFYLQSNLYLSAAKKYEIIPNTIFSEDYELLDKTKLYEQFSIKNDCFTMLTLGRMDYDGLLQKGIEDVIFALHRIKEKFHKEKFSLLIIGQGDQRIYLENLTKKLNLSNNIIFIEQATHIEVLSLSKYVNATVLYSRFEGMSMFALESISFGCLPVFSNVGGLKDLVEDKSSGFLVEPQNISKLTETILQVMKLPETEAQKIRNHAIQHFNDNFTPEIVAEKFSNAVDYVQ